MPTAMVALERERRVGEPALEHAHVPAADDLRVARVRDDRDPPPAEREVALVRLHRGDDHALGQLEELLVERGVEDVRPLDQVDDLVELAGRGPPTRRSRRARRRSPARRTSASGSTPALRSAVSYLPADATFTSPGWIQRCPYECAPDGHAVERHVHRGGAQLREQPAHGPREAERPLPAPLHRLGEREAAHDLRQPLGQRVRDRLAGARAPTRGRRAAPAPRPRRPRRARTPRRPSSACRPRRRRPARPARACPDPPRAPAGRRSTTTSRRGPT